MSVKRNRVYFVIFIFLIQMARWSVLCFITFAFFMFPMKTFGNMKLSYEFTDSVKKWAHFVRILTEKFESVSDKYPCICFEYLSPVNLSK